MPSSLNNRTSQDGKLKFVLHTEVPKHLFPCLGKEMKNKYKTISQDVKLKFVLHTEVSKHLFPWLDKEMQNKYKTISSAQIMDQRYFSYYQVGVTCQWHRTHCDNPNIKYVMHQFTESTNCSLSKNI